ncbi:MULTISPECIES: hypothetical protein [unclassified Caballeronia]|uniref:hypothetical protein n=1 Tax=unclassified Caballeronia TaxID=2646786 RepID=UPI0028599F33|nr:MULTISPECIES: hypothetical protein [unclassified Caballeronia]MDR5776288.1 hypothetical protein [Caballeronia sp. LZ002]MDR5851930.1 hypothetical protein [Caballeronia sp. LZ003]
MKTTAVDRKRHVPGTSPGVLKRTSLEADRELAHIRQVVTAARATSAPLPISVRYWRARLHELRIAYALLPVQIARLPALELEVEQLARKQVDVGASDGRRAA